MFFCDNDITDLLPILLLANLLKDNRAELFEDVSSDSSFSQARLALHRQSEEKFLSVERMTAPQGSHFVEVFDLFVYSQILIFFRY